MTLKTLLKAQNACRNLYEFADESYFFAHKKIKCRFFAGKLGNLC